MDEKELKNNDEVVIDLRRILEAVLKKAWLVVLASVVGAVLSLLIIVVFYFVINKFVYYET